MRSCSCFLLLLVLYFDRECKKSRKVAGKEAFRGIYDEELMFEFNTVIALAFHLCAFYELMLCQNNFFSAHIFDAVKMLSNGKQQWMKTY